jgi:hypothetical protein
MPSSRRAGFVSIVGSKAQYPRFISWVFWINRMLLILSKAALISRQRPPLAHTIDWRENAVICRPSRMSGS